MAFAPIPRSLNHVYATPNTRPRESMNEVLQANLHDDLKITPESRWVHEVGSQRISEVGPVRQAKKTRKQQLSRKPAKRVPGSSTPSPAQRLLPPRQTGPVVFCQWDGGHCRKPFRIARDPDGSWPKGDTHLTSGKLIDHLKQDHDLEILTDGYQPERVLCRWCPTGGEKKPIFKSSLWQHITLRNGHGLPKNPDFNDPDAYQIETPTGIQGTTRAISQQDTIMQCFMGMGCFGTSNLIHQAPYGETSTAGSLYNTALDAAAFSEISSSL